MADFYVSADRPDDTGDGLSWATAKQTFTGVFSLITGLITDVTTIHVKAGTTNPYTGDATLRGILCVGESSLLRIVCEVFNENNYNSTDGSPFNPTDGVGTWNPKETHTTDLRLKLEIVDSNGVQIDGLAWNSEDGEAPLKIEGQSNVLLRYCEFRGLESGLQGIFGALVTAENCYYVENGVGIIAGFRAIVRIVGESYVENPLGMGAWAAGDATLFFNAWDNHPRTKYKTLMQVTGPRNADFSMILANTGATVFVHGQDFNRNTTEIGHVQIDFAVTSLNPGVTGIRLETGALLAGGENISYTTRDPDGKTIELPKAQQVRSESSRLTTSTRNSDSGF
ncbi:hypothetical protein K8I61_02180 [bacterium]|nr:hypothetical protein [bacterium]